MSFIAESGGSSSAASGWSCVKGENGEEGSSALTPGRPAEAGEGMTTETPDPDWMRCLSPDTRGLDILSDFQSNGFNDWAVASKGLAMQTEVTAAQGDSGRLTVLGQGGLTGARNTDACEDAESVWRRITGGHAGQPGDVPGARGMEHGSASPRSLQDSGIQNRRLLELERVPTFPPRVPRFRVSDGSSLPPERSLKRGWSMPPVVESVPPPSTPVNSWGGQPVAETGSVLMDCDSEAPWAPRPSRPFNLELGELTRGVDSGRNDGLEGTPQRGRKRHAQNPLLRTQSDPAHLINPFNSENAISSDSIGPARAGLSGLSSLERQRSVPSVLGGSLLRHTSAPEAEVSQLLGEQILLELQRDGRDPVGPPPVGGVSKKPKLTPRQMQTLLDRQQRLLDSLPPEAWNTARLEPVSEIEELEVGRHLEEQSEQLDSSGLGGPAGPAGQLAVLEAAAATGCLSEDGLVQLAPDARLLLQERGQLVDEGGRPSSSGREFGAGNGHLVDNVQRLSSTWDGSQAKQQPRVDTWAKLDRRWEIMGEWDAHAKKRDALRHLAATRNAWQRARGTREVLPGGSYAPGGYTFQPGGGLARTVRPGGVPESHLQIVLRAMGEFGPGSRDDLTDLRQPGGQFGRGQTSHQGAVPLDEQSARTPAQENNVGAVLSYQRSYPPAFQRITVPDLPGGCFYGSMPNKSIVVPVGPQLASVLEAFQSAPLVHTAQAVGPPQSRQLPAPPPPIEEPLLCSSNYTLPNGGHWAPSEALDDVGFTDPLLDQDSWGDQLLN